MKRVILLSIILIFLITGIGFALQNESIFKNEPDWFRGLKWGDAPTEDMVFLGELPHAGNSYIRIGDKLNIGSADIYHIFYRFNLYSNQFYNVSLRFTGKYNYDILKIIFEGRFGEPTWKDGDWLQWVGDKVQIQLRFNSGKGEGYILIYSMEIRPESPEDNKQKEVEKAEEDF